MQLGDVTTIFHNSGSLPCESRLSKPEHAGAVSAFLRVFEAQSGGIELQTF